MLKQAADRNSLGDPAILFATALICLSGIVLVGAHNWDLGWWMLLAAALAALIPRGRTRMHLLVVVAAVAVLGLADISTDLSPGHLVSMSAVLGLAVVLPYLVLTFGFKDPVISSRLKLGSPWTRGNLQYLAGIALASCVLLPLYLINTGSYHNWMVPHTVPGLLVLFVCVNLLGIWDELFFNVSIFGLFLRHLPFWTANVAQAILWTSFLYRLGFRGWGPLVIFSFALAQGYNFQRTRSVLYVVATHLVLDLVLFGSLVALYLR